MNFKLLGSILLIVGTSIGAGMLALPIATAQLGFVGSLILLFSCWLVMTMGALLLLEVNLWLPLNSNLISMARETIGPVGQVISWITFILLLYSLLCAYIAGGTDLLHSLLQTYAVDVPQWLAALVFICVFGSVVFMGIKSVDYVNRGLMFVKFSAYFLLVIFLLPLVSLPNLAAGHLSHITSLTAITVTITSFGYAAIVPSLRIYFAGDIRQLRLAILVGSLIPLVCYIAWDMVIMGVIPIEHAKALITTSDLVNVLTATAQKSYITVCTRVFTSFCVLTSFLGVALCLVDFLADGLQLEKKGASKIFIHLATFIPPLFIVIFFPNVFIKALEYAGIYCVILLILLPAWMAWNGRYRRHIAHGFKAPGGKFLLICMVIFSIIMLISSVTAIVQSAIS